MVRPIRPIMNEKCEFCGNPAKNSYITETPRIIRYCNNKDCDRKAIKEANRYRR